MDFDIDDFDDYLEHYGTPRHSGRYPWGSGEEPSPSNRDFYGYVNDMMAKGLSAVEIAKGCNISTTELRALKTIERNRQKRDDILTAQKLKDKGMSNVAIGAQMGKNESSVRALLEPGAADKADVITKTADVLRKAVDKHEYVDVGTGVENYLGVSKERLNTALFMLKHEGYAVRALTENQLGTGLDTRYKVLTKEENTNRDVFVNRHKLKQLVEYSEDGGRTFEAFEPPISINPRRVKVKYGDEGGADADGVIYVRPGKEDLSLGGKRYAQVRIKVGENHYLKGMALYKDDLPPGTDLLFNTNKKDTGNKLDAMKKLADDPDYPFGSTVRQIRTEKNGKRQVTSAMNLVNEEGDWQGWSKSISSQVLSKQSPSLARQQLNVTYESRKQDFDDIMRLTNPTVKKKLLEEFAENTDSSAVHLQAAALPRQRWHVILPITDLHPNEVYAPNYRDGERVALIRYPHGGTFEIPELTVNNRHATAKKTLADSPDAIGIHPTVAERLSGADFDGDTVLVIPNGSGKVKSTPSLEKLKGFDPKAEYPAYEGMKPITPKRKQQEMGDVSNLITDMTLHAAPHSDIVKAVKHSMVVIDSEKHNLDYRKSAIDNNIRDLKAKYQGRSNAGASTLISRAESEIRVNERKPRPYKDGGPVDPATGKKVFVETGKTRIDKNGKEVLVKTKSKKLAETDDAYSLLSKERTPMERIYADHSNKLKDLANKARKEALATPRLKQSPSAKKVYATEVASLKQKLNQVYLNRPLERQAQIIGNANYRARKAANPHIEPDNLKKIKFVELEKARARVGAKRTRVEITEKEWEAIQHGAISDSALSEILRKADLDVVRKLATPKTKRLMTAAKTQRAESMLELGYTRAEVASQLGVSLDTLDRAINGDGGDS